MTDTWTWATVTQASPLRIKVDGDTTPLNATTDNLVGSLAVDDRVRVHLHADGIIVTGIQGGGNRSNPNLLINSNFMVNQEGWVSGTTVPSGGYFLDQWRNVSGLDTSYLTWVDAAGVRTLTIGTVAGGNDRAIQEKVEQRNITPGVYTLSFPAGPLGRVYNYGSTPPTFAASPVTVTLDGLSDVAVDLYGVGAELSWVKLERGPIATPYQQPNYDDDLRRCMRYYQRFAGNGRFGSGMTRSTTDSRFVVPMLAPMRTLAPTLTYSADMRAFDGTTAVTLTSLSWVTGSQNIMYLSAVNPTLAANRSAELLAGSASSFITFDARL